MQQKCDQSDWSHFTAKYSSALLENFTIASNVTTESESNYLATKYHQHTCTRSEGVTGCETSEDENTDNITHITSEGECSNIP